MKPSTLCLGLLLLLLERSSALPSSRGLRQPPMEDVIVVDLGYDAPALIEGGEYLVFRGPTLVEEELAAVTCDTIGNYQINSYDDYYADVFLQVTSVGLEDFVYRPSNFFYDHEVNQTFTFFMKQGDAFEIEVWLSENVTEGMILMCRQSPVEELVLGSGVSAPLGIISNEDTSKYYKIEMPSDNPNLYCERSQRAFSWDTYPFSADLHLNDLATQESYECSLSYDSATDTCTANSDGTVILSIVPQYHGDQGGGPEQGAEEEESYRETRSTVTCFAGFVEEISIDKGRSVTTMDLGMGTRNRFLYTTTVPGTLACSILTEQSDFQSQFLALEMVLDQDHEEYYDYELLECTAAKANEACHLSAMAENATVAITVTSTGYTGDAALECSLEETNVETLDLAGDPTATTVELEGGETLFFGVRPGTDAVALASCAATIAVAEDATSDVVLSAVYPRGELPYLLGWTPYVDNDSHVIAHHVDPNATMDWLAWPDPSLYLLSLASYNEEEQRVELDCSLAPIEPLVFDEETRLTETVTLAPEGGMFLIDTRDFEFPLTFGCSMSFVNGTWGSFTTYGGSTGLGFGSSDFSLDGTTFNRPMEHAPTYNQIVLQVDVDDEEGVLETTEERPTMSCYIDEVASSAVARTSGNLAAPAKGNPDLAGFP